MTIKTKQTKNNKQKHKNTNTIQKTKKISNMDPTKNNKGGQQHNTLQKAKNIGSMDPTTTTRRKTTQHNTES
jgi:hypothetical protein